jgi:LPS-assembly lipoprotein
MMLGIANGIKPIHGRPRFRMRHLLLLGTASSLLAGCGFQLVGTGRLPAAMQTTYLDSSEPRSEFYSSLSEALRERGLVLVDSRGDAGARLIISEDSAGQRVLSVTARNIPREYEVFYSVTFALEAEGEPLIQPEALVARRNYTYDETEVLGKEREESLLRRALAEDLARQVVRRIEALSRASPPG